ncbi:MAG: four helix bundle protein [Acidobacteria bacterium]|nr:four helix bundle protein [Acidobacteriota bacterium]
MDLVDMIYALARSLPPEENYGLRSQMTRASVSVPANIAEGSARTTSKDFANFLSNARSSVMELETLLTVALRQDFVPESECGPAFALITEVSKMLTSLRPFRGKKIMEQQLTRDLPDPCELVPEIPEELVVILTKAAQKRPEGRFATAGEMAAALSFYLS